MNQSINKEKRISFWLWPLYAILSVIAATIGYISTAFLVAKMVGLLYYGTLEIPEFTEAELFFGLNTYTMRFAMAIALFAGPIGANSILQRAKPGKPFLGALSGGLVVALISSLATNGFIFAIQIDMGNREKDFQQALETRNSALQNVPSIPVDFQELLSINNAVYNFAMNTDQKLIAYTLQKELILWDLTTNTQRGQTFVAEVSPLGFHLLDFSADGRWLVSTDGENVIVWSVSTMMKTYVLQGQEMAISPDSKTLASVTYTDGSHMIILYDLSSGLEIKRLEGVNAVLLCLKFSPDGNFLAACGSRATDTVFLWNLSTDGAVDQLYLPNKSEDGIYHLTFSPDGKRLAASTRWDLAIWDTETLKPLQGIPATFEGSFINFSPDGRWILSSPSAGLDIYLWDTATQNPVGKISNPSETGTLDAHFLADGHFLALFRTYDQSWTSKIGILTPKDP